MNTGQKPKRLLADPGYKSEANCAALEQRGIDGYISLERREEAREKAQTAGPTTAHMRRKLKTKRGRARHRLRRAVVEPVFGWVKHVIGFRFFSLRGHAAVSAEWELICLALNLRRMNTLLKWAEARRTKVRSLDGQKNLRNAKVSSPTADEGALASRVGEGVSCVLGRRLQAHMHSAQSVGVGSVMETSS